MNGQAATVLPIDLATQAHFLDLTHDAIVVRREPGSVITFWNRAAVDLYGWSRTEAVGQSADRLLSTTYPCPRGEFLAAFAASGSWEGDIVHTSRAGLRLIVASRWALVLDVAPQAGASSTSVEFGTDVTARRAAQDATRRHTARLEESNRQLEEFARVASHDLQEPLRKIRAFGDRLQQRYGDALGPQGGDYLNRMLGAAARMQVLINDVLAYSRLDAAGHTSRPVDLTQMVREAVASLRETMAQTGAEVIIGDLPTVDGEPVQLRRLFDNLLSNALKFRRPDVAPHITVRSEEAGAGSWRVLMEDNGIGFDPGYADRIFGLFERLHGRTVYEGTGIGLPICKRIAEQHGGAITATGRPGLGATFIVTLPGHRGREDA